MPHSIHLINTDDANKALDAVLERYGHDTDYDDQANPYNDDGRPISMGCRYIVDGQPACLVGVVLVEEFGVDPKWLGRNGVNVSRVHELRLGEQGLQLSLQAMNLLKQVQLVQDYGEDWGDAVKFARCTVLGWL